jgi:hypothetical protein
MSPSRLGSKTVHEGWPLTRLLSDGAFVRRTGTVRIARRLTIVTMAVQQLEIVASISPATASGDDVIDFHPLTLREEQSARSTLPVLSLQESCDSGRDLRMVSETGTPIHPIAIIGAADAVDLHMPMNRRLPVTVQTQLPVGQWEDPPVSRGEALVPMSDPPFPFVGVAVGRPSAQHSIEPIIQTREDPGTADPRIVPRPPKDNRVEQAEQCFLAGMAMTLDEQPQLLDVGLDRLGTRHDPRLRTQQTSPRVFG